MNNKFFLVIVAAVGISAVATSAVAAPLPAGTLLKIAPSTDLPAGGSLQPCTTGSCFGAYIGPAFSFMYWTPLDPGADGGIVIGKPQLSGGQEINSLSTADGQLSAVWNFGAEWGTFFTAPDATDNVFDDAPCAGSACIGKTELKVWNMAWNGTVVPAGSASGCNKLLLSNCTFDQVAGIFVKSWTINPVEGGAWRLTYNQVVPEVLPNMVFELILSGTVHFPQNQPPVVTVSPANLLAIYGKTTPFTVNVTDPDGPAAPTCRVATPPARGSVTLNGCSSGSYTSSSAGLTDSFTLIANDGKSDSVPLLVPVTIVIGEPLPTAANVNISGEYGVALTWKPLVTATYSCSIGSPPRNGVAGVASNCSTGSYTANIGFVGTDSFTYIATGSGGNAVATVTAAVTAPDTDTGCTNQYPLKQTVLTGKQGHLTITVTGNIISVNPNGKEIKICPTTTASYNVVTNTPGATVVCKVKSNTSRDQGNVKVNDHIKCTDKPVGNDKLNVKIKSGVNKKVM
jgi:hypothetical protein